MSLFPFLNLFNQMLDVLAPEFFEKGSSAIESACTDIYKWPPPVPGQSMNMKFLTVSLEVCIKKKWYP